MVGRKKEIKELNRLYESNKAEFVAVYGRRRVGKTFLIDSVFDGRYSFRHAGLSPVEGNKTNAMHNQLDHFYKSLLNYGMQKCEKPILPLSFTPISLCNSLMLSIHFCQPPIFIRN